jgi:hypothetical protein
MLLINIFACRESQRALEHATITLNLRQGQANSPDIADFATEVVHDPAYYSFLGSAYIMHNTPPACHKCKLPPPSALNPPPTSPMQTTSIKTTHGVGVKCGTPYFNKPRKCVQPPQASPKPLPPFPTTVRIIKPHGNHTTKPAQSKQDTERKTHLGPLLCTTCNTYGRAYTTCNSVPNRSLV